MEKAKKLALVVDDEEDIRDIVVGVLEELGWEVTQAESGDRAIELAGQRPWQMVFCDVLMQGMDGHAVLKHFRQHQPDVQFVLMTGHGSAAGAIDAVQGGAYDYLLKPFKYDDVETLARAIGEKIDNRDKPAGADANEPGQPRLTMADHNLIGKSQKFLEVMKLVGKVANKKMPVLITGESGTGKEVIARAIHHKSIRAGKPFIAVNCGALPAELIESELFGHVRGAFTGANAERPGLWEEADGGTLFLDEITETSLAFQVKLLRALQEGQIRRVGSNKDVQVNVRVIAACNKDPHEEVRLGRFRQDVLFRLNTVTLNLPLLRERTEDIMSLARLFAQVAAEQSEDGNSSPVIFSPEVQRMLMAYSWPGNIRELQNAVERAAALSDDIVRPEHLPESIRFAEEVVEVLAAGAASQPASAPAHPARDEQSPAHSMSLVSPQEPGGDELNGDAPHDEAGEPRVWKSLQEVETGYTLEVLEYTKGNKQAAARILKIDRKTLERTVRKHQSQVEDVADSAAA